MAQEHMKRSLRSLVMAKCKSELQRDPISHPLEGRTIPSVSEDVGPLDLSYPLAGMQNGTVRQFLRKLIGHISYDLSIPFLIIQVNGNMFTQRLVHRYSQQAYSLITPTTGNKPNSHRQVNK